MEKTATDYNLRKVRAREIIKNIIKTKNEPTRISEIELYIGDTLGFGRSFIMKYLYNLQENGFVTLNDDDNTVKWIKE